MPSRTGGWAVARKAIFLLLLPLSGAAHATSSAIGDGSSVSANVVYYSSSTSIAKNVSSTHTYTTSSGKSFTLNSIEASASARIKVEVRMDFGAGLVTKFVGFTSDISPTLTISLGKYDVLVGSTKQVSVIITNLNSQAQDVYSTIVGNEQ